MGDYRYAKLLGQLIVPIIVLVYIFAFFNSISDLGTLAAGFPQVVLSILLITVIGAILVDGAAWRKGEAGAVDDASPYPKEDWDQEAFEAATPLARVWMRWRDGIVMIVALVAFTTALDRLAFYTSVTAFLLFTLWFLGVRPIWRILLSVGVAVPIIWGLFDLLLRLRVPSGIFI